MRWWWCDARPAAVLLLAACVRTTTVSYLPSSEQPRLSLDEGRATLARFVGLECERLRAEGRPAGETRFVVRLDSAGLATAAELARTTGDARVDGIAGAVAAQLRLDDGRADAAGAPPRAARAEVDVGYRCADDGGVAVTLERRPDA